MRQVDKPILREISAALRMTLITLALTGFLYPLAVTGLAGLIFPVRAQGSLLHAQGRVVGSQLIGQRFEKPGYFQGRPSAAGSSGYDGTASGGSNLGPTSKTLRERVAAEVERVRLANPGAPGPVPIELVTASGSGLDPDLSPRAALWQVPRIAAARNLEPAELEALIARHTEPRTLGFLGEPRVNVLRLNLDLDRRLGNP
jgi:K+-transporting ATPase ATPase C chain